MATNGLPRGWASAQLRDVVTPSKNKVEPGALPAETPYLSLEHIDAGTGRIIGSGTAADVRSTKAVFEAGDVLYGRLRPYLNKVVVPGFSGICSTDIIVFKGTEIVRAQFLRWFLSRPSVVAYASHHSTGDLPRVSFKSLGALEVPLPPLEEQIRVVAALEELEAHRVGASEHVTRAQAALERFRYSVLAAACSGRLTVDWRERIGGLPDVAEAPELSPAAAKHASGAPNTHELAEFPPTWKAWSIESVTDHVVDYRGRTPPPSPDGTIPHLRTTNLRDGTINWEADRFVTEETYKKFMTRGIPERGDVLFTMEAPLGEVGVVDRDERFSLAQRILLMRPSEVINGSFLALALRSPLVRRAIDYRSTGSTVRGVAYKRLRSVTIPVPPANEQEEILRRVDDLLKRTATAEAALQRAQRQVADAAEAIAAKAFRGELLRA